MRRSKAIKIIGDIIWNYNLDSTDIDYEANRILEALEKSGIEAPKVKVKTINPIDFPYGAMCTMRCNCQDCNPEYLINKWEKEDET